MARTRTRLFVTMSAAAALCAGATGCSFSASTSSNLDIPKAEQEIAKGIQEQTGETATVECPEPVEMKQGGTFICTATFTSGLTGTISVEQTDDQGNVNWQLEPVVSPTPS
jgi:hypothetical protein